MDASILIAHLNAADPHHQAATDVLLSGAHGHMLVHTITLAEVLVGGVRIGRAISMRDDLHAAGITVAPHDDGESLRLAELRVSTGLKLPDCCVLDVAIRHQASLATFDQDLAGEARKRGVLIAARSG
jgi:predicted nucleic acid-binding protein